MGESKLLLPWGDDMVIDAVLQAWSVSRVDSVVVVVRRDDDRLIDACRSWQVQVVTPETDPPDMKASVQIGLRYLAQQYSPHGHDHCFIAPADLPALTSVVINRLIEAVDGSARIVVPRFGERPGHPALLPWGLTQQIFALKEDQGVNQIVQAHDKLLVEFPASARIRDMDTPRQYQDLRDLHGDGKTGTK